MATMRLDGSGADDDSVVEGPEEDGASIAELIGCHAGLHLVQSFHRA